MHRFHLQKKILQTCVMIDDHKLFITFWNSVLSKDRKFDPKEENFLRAKKFVGFLLTL